jgi:hypothetical protein
MSCLRKTCTLNEPPDMGLVLPMHSGPVLRILRLGTTPLIALTGVKYTFCAFQAFCVSAFLINLMVLPFRLVLPLNIFYIYSLDRPTAVART